MWAVDFLRLCTPRRRCHITRQWIIYLDRHSRFSGDLRGKRVDLSKISLNLRFSHLLHFTSTCTDRVSELPTLFWPWHVYSPASRRPTGRSWSVSCRPTTSDLPTLRHTMPARGFASASHRNVRKSLPSSKSTWGAPSKRMTGGSVGRIIGIYYLSSLIVLMEINVTHT